MSNPKTRKCCGETFTYDERLDAWLWGKPDDGIGVVECNGVWHGNVIKKGDDWVLAYGPWDTAEEGMEVCIKAYKGLE